ncbi:GNAT family N-acetyltransferase [Demequina sp. NBRC 110055]|uniref:GNAT family N-acetyltransferase n=1 Tax=Demequina sp. NBRC 110055 TaxID=1570344 RepID=UPI000A027D9F|nr:GNAT family N-acetyltransferase [Demequina sp. NBRC 110055]
MSFAASPRLSHALARLEPLSPAHTEDLAAAVAVEDLWRTWVTSVPSPDDMRDEIDRRVALQTAGSIAAWAIIDPRRDRAVGMTTYLNLDEDNRRLEIGSTWIGREAQGTGVNPAAKVLLLTRAFEDLGCHAVEFRTHWHNHQSRAAIARLGAKQDGVLRAHKVMPDGTLRDTVVFSIIAPEWPAARAALSARLSRYL